MRTNHRRRPLFDRGPVRDAAPSQADRSTLAEHVTVTAGDPVTRMAMHTDMASITGAPAPGAGRLPSTIAYSRHEVSRYEVVSHPTEARRPPRLRDGRPLRGLAMSATFTHHIITSPADPVSGHVNDGRPVLQLGDLDIIVASRLTTSAKVAWLTRLIEAATDLRDAVDGSAPAGVAS